MVIKDNIDALYLSLLNYIFTFIRTVATTLNSAILCNIQKEYYRFGIYFGIIKNVPIFASYFAS